MIDSIFDMTTKDAILILKEFNKWRRGVEPYSSPKCRCPYSGADIGKAIEIAIAKVGQADALFNALKSFLSAYHSTINKKILDTHLNNLSNLITYYENR